ncbi:hypothetical protein R3P38DRAFT_3231572 [Favolaschia claudopus]|uniref:Uncharacterized protein n=1 Tax=Favolaschia claudopus TaxID=2862362 RepID=A0AAV9ZK95_9AGAR
MFAFDQNVSALIPYVTCPNATLADSGLPKIATRDVPEEIGFRLVLKGKTYSFPFDCAPPEGYLTVDYSA